MDVRHRPTVLLAIGLALLVGGFALVSLGWPAHTTAIVATADDEQAMADSTHYSTGEIDPIPYSELSASEQTAFTRARQSPDGRYATRFEAVEQSALDYRNDVSSTAVVESDGRLYLVRTWIDIDPILTGVGGLVGIVGTAVSLVGLWTGWKKAE